MGEGWQEGRWIGMQAGSNAGRQTDRQNRQTQIEGRIYVWCKKILVKI
jgi:hypothetical protein